MNKCNTIQKEIYEWLTIGYGAIYPSYGIIGRFQEVFGPFLGSTRLSANLRRFGLSFKQYWLDLHVKSCAMLVNNLKYNRPPSITLIKQRTSSKPSSDMSERVRSSRHTALTDIIDSDQLLRMSKTSKTHCNILFLGGAWKNPSPPSIPIGPIRPNPSIYGVSYCCV